MKKIEYVGLFVFIMLLSGVGITLYPRKLVVAMHDTIIKVAKKYAHEQLFKIMVDLDNAKKTQDAAHKKKVILKAKKRLKKMQRAMEYIQEHNGNVPDVQEKANISLAEVKQMVNHAQWLIEQATLKPEVVTKKEKMTAELEALI